MPQRALDFDIGVKRYDRNKMTAWAVTGTIFQFSKLSKSTHLGDQIMLFFNETFHTLNITCIHHKQAIRTSKFCIKVHEHSRGKMVTFGHCTILKFLSTTQHYFTNLSTKLTLITSSFTKSVHPSNVGVHRAHTTIFPT